MESEENETSFASSYESNSSNRQRLEESTEALSVKTQPTVSHRSLSSSEADACNRLTSLNLKSEEGEPARSQSRKSSLSSALKFSRHFVNSETGIVEEDDVSYSDTFDSLDSLSETEDDPSKTVHKTPASIRSDSNGDQSDSSGSRSNSRLLSNNEEETLFERQSRSSSSEGEDTVSSEEENARSFSDGPESLSDGEGGIRSLSPAALEENALSSLSLSSDSSIWSPSASISDQYTTDHSIEDKFTSADGEIIYYSDFSLEALTARQYTHRSDISEWSQNLGNETVIPALEEFFQKKIRLLRRQSSSDGKVAPPVFSARSRNTGGSFRTLSQVALHSLGLEDVESVDFCSKKLHHLRNHQTDSGVRKALQSGATNFCKHLKDETDVLSYGIPFSVIQRLRIERKSMIDFHEPAACDRCRQELGQLGLSEFVLSKMAVIREQLTNLKLNDARNNSMYGMKVLGEILSKASSLSRQPELVMQHLLEPLTVHRTVAGTVVNTV